MFVIIDRVFITRITRLHLCVDYAFSFNAHVFKVTCVEELQPSKSVTVGGTQYWLKPTCCYYSPDHVANGDLQGALITDTSILAGRNLLQVFQQGIVFSTKAYIENVWS